MMLAASAPAALAPGERLILVGRDGAELDACGATGQVTNLSRRGDNFLSVRVAPSATAREKSRIGTGQLLSLCDTQGEWIGVVYRLESDGDINCGVGTPSAYLGAYRGPCRYGWVNRRFVELLAG
jgi:hypothetical protein